MKEPFFHKFVVFSVIDDNDKVIEKFCHCNNCGVVHKVFDLCQSEIVVGRESSLSIMTQADIKLSLPQNLSKILETYECDLPVWEEVQFYYETGLDAPPIILTKEEFKGTVSGKILHMLGSTKVKIEPFTREEMDYKIIQKVGRRIFRLTKAIYGEKINIEFKDDDENVDSLMDKYKKEAVNLFQQMDTLGSFITDSSWLLNLDKYYLIRFLRELRDCWEYRLQLTNETKMNICPPYGRPFESVNITSLGHRQYPYVLRKTLKVINKLINTGVDDKSKNLGIFYVLGALTIQSQEAANALPWMYESFAVQNN